MSADPADADAIRELIERYARAVDARDAAALTELFTPDAIVTLPEALSGDVLPTELNGAQVARVLDGVSGFDRTRHAIDEHRATFDGSAAHAETTCSAHHITGDRDLVLTVGYRDTFGRHGGRWLFERRELRLDASRRQAVRPVAMITGATRGIGRAIAVAFARAGFDVVITGRTVREGTGRVPPRIRRGENVEVAVAGSLESTAAEIATAGAEPLSVRMDLADRESVIDAAAQALRAFGRIDVLVNNAIAHLPGSHDPLRSLDARTVEEAMRANFTHQLLLVQQVLPHMAEHGGGVVVNVYSGSATTDPPGLPDAGGWGLAYSSSKAAFGRIAGAINAEYRERGVRAFNLDPGFVVTESGVARGGTANIAARGFDTASPGSAAAVAVHLATAPDADRLLGKVIRAPKLAADLGLLDS